MIINWEEIVSTPSYIGVRATEDIECLDPRHELIHREAERKGFACAVCDGYW